MKKTITYIGSLIIALLFSAQIIAAPVYLTQTTSQIPLAFYGVSCQSGLINTANQYLRVYDLVEYGITTNLEVTQVEFGIGLSVGPLGSGQQPVNINLYTLSGPLSYVNMTLISSTTVIIFDSQTLTTPVFNVNPTIIPSGSIMVVEYTVQNNLGLYGDGQYFPGANDLGQTHECYIAATECGIPDPISLSDIGFPDNQNIINVYGETQLENVPVANWAIFLAVGMMVVLSVLIIRRRMA